ncbi:DUF222 domain-containing protein [Pseudonocardia sp.]|uniref:HNH endonuclease n=1 Tax=Pseudonocardia sp. TaxID=60912 RepID=UPI003D118D04
MTAALPEQRLVEEVARLERLKNRIAARQAEAIREFARAHVASQTADGRVEPGQLEGLERSIVAQVGLACRVAPVEARRRLRVARDLHAGHDRVRALFAAGELGEYQVATIIAATSHLDEDARAEVDRQLAERRVETLGVRRIHDLARTLAAAADPDGFARRCRAARSGRRVTVRPAADGMADLTAHLPVEQAVACYATLARAAQDAAASPEPLTRGRGQVMADTLVERLTGRATPDAVPAEIQILVPVEALLDPTSPLPAQIPGHGPLPTQRILDNTARKTWRRLLTRDGIIIGGDSRRRAFTGTLAELIRARDGHRCREPHCDAPIRHLDHIHRHTHGGPTSFTNGRGLCAFHNHTRETPGWTAHVVDSTGNTVITTTPTGHRYHSTPTATITPPFGRAHDPTRIRAG